MFLKNIYTRIPKIYMHGVVRCRVSATMNDHTCEVCGVLLTPPHSLAHHSGHAAVLVKPLSLHAHEVPLSRRGWHEKRQGLRELSAWSARHVCCTLPERVRTCAAGELRDVGRGGHDAGDVHAGADAGQDGHATGCFSQLTVLKRLSSAHKPEHWAVQCWVVGFLMVGGRDVILY